MRRILIAVLLLAVAAGCGGGGSPLPPASETDEREKVDVEPAAAEVEPTVEPDPEPAPSPPIDDGAWMSQTSTNPLDDSRTVVALLDAVEGVGGLSRDPIRLIARCQSNETEAYVTWHDFLGDDDLDNVYSERKRVTYRFPPTDAQTEMWNVSTDNDSTFVDRPIPFLRTLVASERLVVQTTPYGESPSTAIFALAGAEATISPIAEECGWILDRVAAEREASERAEAAARVEEERLAAEARAEAERLADYTDSRFRLANVQQSPRGAMATAGLPDGIMLAYFVSTLTASQIRLNYEAGATVNCPRAEMEGNQTVLVECEIEGP